MKCMLSLSHYFGFGFENPEPKNIEPQLNSINSIIFTQIIICSSGLVLVTFII